MKDTLIDLKNRRSCKAYTDELVPDEILNQILEAGTYAACGKNAQAAVIVMVKDKALRDKLSKMNAEVMGAQVDPFYNAPYVAVVLADTNVPTWVEDGSLVLGNMMLAAEALGVGSCWIHRARQEFDSEEGKAMLKEWGLAETYRGVGHLILGYKAKEPVERKPRKENYIIIK